MSKKPDEAEHQSRPRRLLKREREEAQRQYRLHQKHRQWMEAEIARREELGQSTEQIAAELDLWIPPEDPAVEFLRKRLNEIRADDPLFDRKWQQAVVDLVASDVPLDPVSRRLIAGELQRFYFPKESDNQRKQRIELLYARRLQDHLQTVAGMSATDAEAEVAESLGISVDALRRRRTRQQSKRRKHRRS
jgi:hypothetical protein